MKAIYKNWFVHNMVGHPLSEVAYWMAFVFSGERDAERLSGYIHDATKPEHVKGTGRG